MPPGTNDCGSEKPGGSNAKMPVSQSGSLIANVYGDMIPVGVGPNSGGGPFPLTNTATVTATPDGGGTPVILSDSVTANFN